MEYKLHDYQQEAVNRMLQNKHYYFIGGVGTGKTLTTLDFLAKLKSESTLIIAPKAVVDSETWQKEMIKWQIDVPVDVVSETQVHKITKQYDTIIIDELHSFKSQTTQKFKRVLALTKTAERVYGLSGTPTPNTYTDMFAQLKLIQAEGWYRTLTAFRQDWTTSLSVSPTVTVYKFKEELEHDFIEYIKPWVYVVDNKGVNPEREDKTVLVDLPDNVRAVYEDLRKENAHTDLELVMDAIGSTPNKAVMQTKLLHIASGGVYTGGGVSGEELVIHPLHGEKIKALNNILDKVPSALIVYNFKIERIYMQMYATRVEIYDRKTAKQQIDDFINGKIKFLAVNPKQLSAGVNLQNTQTVIWVSHSYSLTDYIQTTARVFRQGNSAVKVYHIMARDTIDTIVIEALKVKQARQDNIFEAGG